MERGNTMTITLSFPKEMKPFFDGLAKSGYNRSMLMVKMAMILKELEAKQETHPGGLPWMIDRLLELERQGKFLELMQSP